MAIIGAGGGGGGINGIPINPAAAVDGDLLVYDGTIPIWNATRIMRQGLLIPTGKEIAGIAELRLTAGVGQTTQFRIGATEVARLHATGALVMGNNVALAPGPGVAGYFLTGGNTVALYGESGGTYQRLAARSNTTGGTEIGNHNFGTQLLAASVGFCTTATGEKLRWENFQVRLSQGFAITRVIANVDITLTLSNCYVGVGLVAAGGRNITLPMAASAGPGALIVIKDENGNATVANPIRAVAPAGNTVDGAANALITVARGSMLLICQGGNSWGVVARFLT